MTCQECKHNIKFSIAYDDSRTGKTKTVCIFCFNKLGPRIVKDFFREYITKGIEAKLNIWSNK